MVFLKKVFIVIGIAFMILCSGNQHYTISVDRKDYKAGIDDVSDANLKACIMADDEYGNGITAITSLTCSKAEITNADGIGNLTGLVSLDLQKNRISEIDVSALTHLETLTLSNNWLKSIDVSALSSLKNLYISSNHDLSSLDVSHNTNLESITVALTNIEKVAGLESTAVKSLTITHDKLSNYHLSDYAHLERIGFIDHKTLPIYGTTLTKEQLLNLIPSNITVSSYHLYDWERVDSYDELFGNDNIYTAKPGDYLNVLVYAFDDVGGVAKNVNVTNNSLIQGFNGYYDFYFVTLSSKRYPIDQTNKTIAVGNDTADIISKNIEVSWPDYSASIDDAMERLDLFVDGQKIASFKLLHDEVVPIPNTALFQPKTLIILGILFLGLGLGIFHIVLRNRKRYNI